MRSEFEPGVWVRHPREPGWGAGQVQSAIGAKVTVMFENAGKVVVNTAVVTLEYAPSFCEQKRAPPGEAKKL